MATECLCRTMMPDGPESVYISDFHCPIHTKSPKLPCGCIKGITNCPEADELAGDIVDAMGSYEEYKQAQEALREHWEGQE